MQPQTSEAVSYDALSPQEQQLFEDFKNAMREGDETKALELIEKGLPPNTKQNPSGVTPLHWASYFGYEKVALALIERGARVDIRDAEGNTPLHDACAGVHEKLALKLIERGALVDVQSKFSYTPYDEALDSDYFKDMLASIARHLLMPAMLLEAQSADLDMYEVQYQHILHTLMPPPDLAALDQKEKLSEHDKARLMRPIRLSRSWHHPPITFPEKLLPLKQNRQWQPLLEQDFTAPNGLTITCLSSTQELEEETRQMCHCVGNSDYDKRCCLDDAERSHIFSIRDGDGHAISTVEATYENDHIFMVQHEGDGGKTPPEKAQQAWQAFEQAVNAGEVTLADPATLGETTPPDADPEIPENWKTIGFKPSWEHINLCYDEYRMPYRRASLPTNGRRLEYDDIKTEDGYTHQHHLIDGYAITDAQGVPVKDSYRLEREELPALQPGQHVVSIRDLDAKSMLRATGMMDQIHQEIDQQLGEDPQRTLRWQKEAKEPLVKRPLPIPRYQVRADLAAYEASLRRDAGREESPYFVHP